MLNRLALALTTVTAFVFVNAAAGAPDLEPEKDPRLADSLHEARRLIDDKQHGAAVRVCDKVIAAYAAKYRRSKDKVYCSRSGVATLGTLLSAAAKKENAIVLSMTWPDAYFMKGYALQELGRLGEAKQAVQAAVKLAPFESHYLNELGQIYGREKNWAKAKEQFRDAEEYAAFAPDDMKADELARARRGLGYVYVELGQLGEAEKKYRECLATNPQDFRARAELQYVLNRKDKQKPAD